MPRHPAFNKIFTENLLSARFCAGGIDDEKDDDGKDGDAESDGDAAAAAEPGAVLSTSQICSHVLYLQVAHMKHLLN